jgi:hypothetical protein
MYLLYVPHSTYSKQQFLTSGISYILLFFLLSSLVLTKNYIILDCAVVQTHFNNFCVLALTTLKMATWVPLIFWCPICNKITSIKAKCIFCYFSTFYAFIIMFTRGRSLFLSWVQWIHVTHLPFSYKINFNSILTSTSNFSCGPFPSGFSNKLPTCISFLSPCVCCQPLHVHHSWFGSTDNIL